MNYNDILIEALKDDLESVKAVFFDSGNVLSRTKSGSWIFPFDNSAIVDISKIDTNSEKFHRAIAETMRYMEMDHNITDEEDECEFIKNIYLNFFSVYGDIIVKDVDYDKLAKEQVYHVNSLAFYSDVKSCLTELKKRYKLGVVAVPYPSNKRMYVESGYYDYFDIFEVSCFSNDIIGRYNVMESALRKNNLGKNQVIYVSSRESRLLDAKNLGMIPIKMNRYKVDNEQEFITIHSLDELIEILI